MQENCMEINYCKSCPRKCRVNRINEKGFCGESSIIRAAKACLHKWEEPCISTGKGAGAVFFSGCNMKCVYCQNYNISSCEQIGMQLSVSQLADIFLRLQDAGAANTALVTPTHFSYEIIKALDMVRHKLKIPVIYNCGGYELVSVIHDLNGYVDIYLPDIKYYSHEIAFKYSSVNNYFKHASEAVIEMTNQLGNLKYSGDTLIRGTIIRHLIIPNCRKDSIKIMEWINDNLDKNKFLLSLMSQYTPNETVKNSFSELNRRITKMEYNSVLKKAAEFEFNGFSQDKSSAASDYTPDFDLSGLTG